MISWQFRKNKKTKQVNIVKANWFKRFPLGKSMPSLIAKADRIFSRFKRLQALMPAGYIRCFTCGAFMTMRTADNGHYINREHMGTRYHEQNCAPQCSSCNSYAEGRKSTFAINLIKKYGPDILDQLEKAKQDGRFMTTARLEEIIAYYKPLVKELEIEKLGRTK